MTDGITRAAGRKARAAKQVQLSHAALRRSAPADGGEDANPVILDRASVFCLRRLSETIWCGRSLSMSAVAEGLNKGSNRKSWADAPLRDLCEAGFAEMTGNTNGYASLEHRITPAGRLALLRLDAKQAPSITAAEPPGPSALRFIARASPGMRLCLQRRRKSAKKLVKTKGENLL